jgi:ribosomal protein S18 acetylase RimI-like enzyme
MVPLVRQLRPKDRSGLESLLRKIAEFGPDQVSLILDLLSVYLKQLGQMEYIFYVAVSAQDQILGFICYGPTPLTQGTFDIYWLGVDPDCAGQGIAVRLLHKVEKTILAGSGRLIVIEQSTTPANSAIRAFFLKNGYCQQGTIADFYRPAEDRLTFVKYL